MAKKDLFAILNKRLEKRADSQFDQSFWAKFGREFEKKPQPFGLPVWARFLAPAGIAALFVIVMWTQQPKLNDNDIIAEVALFENMAGDPDFIQSLELVGDDFEALSELTDQQWDEILGNS